MTPPSAPRAPRRPRKTDAAVSSRSWVAALILSLVVGWTGADRFYLGYSGLGIAKLLTAGGCGIWWFVDALLLILGQMKDADGLALEGQEPLF